MDKKNPKTRSRARKYLSTLGIVVLLVVLGVAGYGFYVRITLANFRVIVEGKAYRSAQPDAEELTSWVKKYGLKTVINLRGENSRQYYLDEKRVLDQAGVQLISMRFSAGRRPTIEEVKQLIDALETAERPILIHCMAGVDRSGLASVLAAMLIGEQKYRDAMEQLSLKYFRIMGKNEWDVTGIFTEYERYCQREGVDTGGWAEFKQWAVNIYHPCYYFIDIDAPKKIVAHPGQRIPLQVRITNRSGKTMRTGNLNLIFWVDVFRVSEKNDLTKNKVYRRGTFLPQRDLQPDESVEVTLDISAPQEPGKHVFHYKVCTNKKEMQFGRKGSAEPTCELIVKPK